MKAYVDSGIPVKLNIRERNPSEAFSALGQFKSIKLNQLQELELEDRPLQNNLASSIFKPDQIWFESRIA